MNWFFKWLYNGLKSVEQQLQDERNERIFESPMPKVRRNPGLAIGRNNVATASSDNGISLNHQPLNFRIYPATGGHIVEYSFYNEKTDRNDQALHLISSDLDLGSELAKIMTLEALKR